MFTHPCREMVDPLPWMTDRVRYDIWRYKRNSEVLLDTFNRMAWIGDDALKTQVTKYLYEKTIDRIGADSLLLHDLRETFECRWCQLVITIALGLDEEMDRPLPGLRQGMDRSHAQIKVYADILEGYIGGLCARDREAADDWIFTLIRRFYRDLMKEVDSFLKPWQLQGRVIDVTCIRLRVDWSSYFGPILELRPRPGYQYIGYLTKPLLRDCFIMTSFGHEPRFMQHPVVTQDDLRKRPIRPDTFSQSFKRGTLGMHRTAPITGMRREKEVFSSSLEARDAFGRVPAAQGATASSMRDDHSASHTSASSGSRSALAWDTPEWLKADLVDLTIDEEDDEEGPTALSMIDNHSASRRKASSRSRSAPAWDTMIWSMPEIVDLTKDEDDVDLVNDCVMRRPPQIANWEDILDDAAEVEELLSTPDDY
ncbi:hypothetical protein CALCODRAFT_519513 [Calocera cornea HHB12733]|uniref:RNase III domain-containing protein n=1 Tax=Calocera cornea HHB12733 TaxID=1353952 RepID=A0A165E7G3_9BASI|nr:hypothetical protein CALCODRAFT_519513 [Calocera cornea HHB12733]